MALVCSAHGYGHTTRQLVLGAALRDRGAVPTVFSAAPAGLVRERLPGAALRPWTVDVGIVQPDALREDPEATAAAFARTTTPAALDALAAALAGFDRVVVDTAPAALAACRRAGVPCAAVGNFDWAWIYDHYPGLAGPAAQLRRWQAPHVAASLWPGPGLRGFARVHPLGLLAPTGRRVPLPRSGAHRVLVAFGGFGLDRLDALLPRLPGVDWVTAAHGPALDRPDVVAVPGVAFPDLVASVDLVLSKPGYGILGECLTAGTPALWLPRGAFPEAAALTAVLRDHGGATCAPTAAALREAVPDRLARPRPAPLPATAAAVLADWVLSPGFPLAPPRA